MIIDWSYYDLATGIFTGQRVGGDEAMAQDLCPAGCGYMSGAHDHLRVCVDVSADPPALADYRPTAPADDTTQTWAWDDTSRRWLASPTPMAVASCVRADRDGRLAATDWVVLRAVESGTPPSAAWAAYRQALRDVPAQPGFPHTITWPEEPTA